MATTQAVRPSEQQMNDWNANYQKTNPMPSDTTARATWIQNQNKAFNAQFGNTSSAPVTTAPRNRSGDGIISNTMMASPTQNMKTTSVAPTSVSSPVPQGAQSMTATSAPATQQSNTVKANTTSAAVPALGKDGIIQSVAGYDPSQLGDISRWNVDSDQTVEGRLNGLMAKDSPMLQMARQRSAQAANANGILNSTLAMTAGDLAAYDAMMPIASQDAETFGKSAMFNADSENQFKVKNVDAQNAAKAFLADSTNAAGRTNAQTQTQLIGTRETNSTNERMNVLDNQTQKYGIDTNAAVQREDIGMRRDVATMQDRTNRDIAQWDNSTRMSLGRLDYDARIATTRMTTATQERVAQINGQFSERIANTQVAGDLQKQFMVTMANIEQAPNTSKEWKISMQNNAAYRMENAMNTYAAVSDALPYGWYTTSRYR